MSALVRFLMSRRNLRISRRDVDLFLSCLRVFPILAQDVAEIRRRQQEKSELKDGLRLKHSKEAIILMS